MGMEAEMMAYGVDMDYLDDCDLDADLEALRNDEISDEEDQWKKRLDEAWAKRTPDEIIENLKDCAELLFHHGDQLTEEQLDKVAQIADFLSFMKG